MKLDKYLNEGKKPPVIDELGKFWVVTLPTEHSELEDIYFEADIFRMQLQFLGGLKKDEIVGIYKNHNKAKKHAEKLLGMK